jgi:hypothetical protein
MDLIAGLHQFLFPIEEDSRESRLFFGKREDRLIDNLLLKLPSHRAATHIAPPLSYWYY